ncbi:MAG: hypothetical protein JSW48_14860 [Betaproteobacteria bacterium]|nr:MAG: hypothetical protein JSW48_14860 [Betaproteobacteria bacterium]
MKGSKLTGVAIAASAASLFLGGCESTTGQQSSRTEAKIACEGANACKGLSECKTANSACAGQNECKGQGLVMLSAVECAKVAGAGG